MSDVHSSEKLRKYRAKATVAVHCGFQWNCIWIGFLDFEHADEFIYLLGDGYYAGTFDQSQQILVFKTWVSRSSWTPKSEAKLTLLADQLAEELQAVYINAKEFERSVFLAPGDYMKTAVTVDPDLLPI